ncbi:deoxyhypusine synthase [archaeon]|nr:deoxyhypusine synthase [archaeon]
MDKIEKIRKKEVRQIHIKKGMSINEFVNEMHNSGVMGAGRLARACLIYKKMLEDKDCKIFLGVAGAMVPGGLRKVVADMVNKRIVDVLVMNGANLMHDLVEGVGYKHYKGSEHENDEQLHKNGIDRIYDSFMPNEVYGAVEDFFEKNWKEISGEGKRMGIREFLFNIGRVIEDEDSILRACFKKSVPIFCPALADSGIGLMVWGRLAKGMNINVDAFLDMTEIIDIAWTSKKNGVFYIGGGTPKNFIQQAMQFSKGASYGIQVTMDRPEHGGSSGAPLKEGISWGKIEPCAEFVDVICDATIALPIIYGYCADAVREADKNI